MAMAMTMTVPDTGMIVKENQAEEVADKANATDDQDQLRFLNV